MGIILLFAVCLAQCKSDWTVLYYVVDQAIKPSKKKIIKKNLEKPSKLTT